MHIFGERTVLELQGVSCIPIVKEIKVKKGILSSKSFSSPVSSANHMKEAVPTYMARAREKLRFQNSAD